MLLTNPKIPLLFLYIPFSKPFKGLYRMKSVEGRGSDVHRGECPANFRLSFEVPNSPQDAQLLSCPVFPSFCLCVRLSIILLYRPFKGTIQGPLKGI